MTPDQAQHKEAVRRYLTGFLAMVTATETLANEDQGDLDANNETGAAAAALRVAYDYATWCLR